MKERCDSSWRWWAGNILIFVINLVLLCVVFIIPCYLCPTCYGCVFDHLSQNTYNVSDLTIVTQALNHTDQKGIKLFSNVARALMEHPQDGDILDARLKLLESYMKFHYC